MIESLLIANRGEIARRIMRTAKRMGIRTIAVYSSADANAAFVREADSAVAIGAAPARESYLDGQKLLAAARREQATAIHPGYGFLSENAEFADAVQAAGLVWVGAPPAAIRAMGLKDAAKRLMMQAGVPVTPGYLGECQAIEILRSQADAVGYPLLIKAVAGGGGKGMRRVETAAEFDAALASCQREARAAFGDDRVLLEKFISSPRHIEVQVFGDTFGDVVHLFERDCSLQRRHQKVIEEAPAPGMDAATRDALCAIAVKAAKAVDYVGAGTIEFIADASRGLHADRIWFMEMNTRLQVEHPVTEAITGQDLVEWQLRIASGERLPCRQSDLLIDGCAIEARLYAENPSTGFLPSIGPLHRLRFPTDIRVDSGFDEGAEVTGFYDPMIAKLIVHATNRRAAVRELAKACAAVEVWPVRTNAAFLRRVAVDPAFTAGDIDTGFIERHAQRLIPGIVPDQSILRAAARASIMDDSVDPWIALTGFRSSAPPFLEATLAVGGATYTVPIDLSAPRSSIVDVESEPVLFLNGEAWSVGSVSSAGVRGADVISDGILRSPMPGRIVNISVRPGQSVKRGQTLLTLEAMKMEHAILAPFDGVVADIEVAEGQQVTENIVVARVEAGTP
jgi:3-methylcrotonyl-CoA carboxylase alpha subunit